MRSLARRSADVLPVVAWIVPREALYKADRPRAIDRYIDYLGGSRLFARRPRRPAMPIGAPRGAR